MKKWRNLRNAENGRYKLSVIVLSVLLAASLLWQGVFAMLGTTSVDADAFALMEAFSADIGDGLHEQRQAAWRYAVRNPSAEGGVWDQFWGTAQFGAAGGEAVPTPAPTPAPTPTPTPEPTPTPIPTWPNVPNPGLRSTFMDTRGIVWRVIATDGNATLIMTEHVHGVGVQYNTTNVYTRLSQSNLRIALDGWGAMNLAPELAARARVPNNVDNDVRDAPGEWWPIVEENGAAGRTSPGAAVANVNGALFVLSLSEVNHYAATVGTTNEERIARDTSGTIRFWWLRSPGAAENSSSVAIVDTNGTRNARNALNTSFGFRPALWISI